MAKILIVDDERVLVKGIKFNLSTRATRSRTPMTERKRWSWPGRGAST